MEDDDWFAPEPDMPQKPSISPKPIPKSQNSPTKDSEELDDDWFAEAPPQPQSPKPEKQNPPKFQLDDHPEDSVYPGTEDGSGDWFDKVSEDPAEYITVPSVNNAPRKESYMFGFVSKVCI